MSKSLSSFDLDFLSYQLIKYGNNVNAYGYHLGYTFDYVDRMPIELESGYSVRCIKD